MSLIYRFLCRNKINKDTCCSFENTTLCNHIFIYLSNCGQMSYKSNLLSKKKQFLLLLLMMFLLPKLLLKIKWRRHFHNREVCRADAGMFNAWSVEYLSLIAFLETNRAGKLISIFFASCVHWKTFCVPNISTLYIIWPSPFSLPSLPKMVVNLFSTGKWYSCWKK